MNPLPPLGGRGQGEGGAQAFDDRADTSFSFAMTTKGMLRDRARGMRKQPSRAESALWTLLRGRQIRNAKFRRQHPIDRYIADFACIDAKLVVEIDGRSHDNAEQIAYDAERTTRLTELGWTETRVRDDDVLTNPQTVAARIEAALKHKL